MVIKNKNSFKKKLFSKKNIRVKQSLGQKYWLKANNIIPGGTMLFSKNPDLQLPNLWPAYFSKAKGCSIWDLEGKKYNDVSLMGVGTNILGYSNLRVEKKIKQIIASGNMATLNSIEEILLAEKLINLHPWAEMVRFTRTGGEANAVAIRIARAASGKDKVAVCGYHGWHDWYLSTNINNKNNLKNHLMDNLDIAGVPKNLKNTVFPFDYNDFNHLKNIVDKHNIGVIKMEVERNTKPKNNFLQRVRSLADKKNIILIFDECSSGFRETFGGIHKKHGINPDMAIFGKAMGNGYAINAIIGKRNVMEACSKTFISSTFWTERIGPTAALETLKIMEDIKSWQIISKIGIKIKKNWEKLAKKHNLDIKIQGIDSIPNFYFKPKFNLEYKTLISQEMLKKNILANNLIFTCIYHKETILNKYFQILDTIFQKIKYCEDEKENIHNLIDDQVCISGLRFNNKHN